MGTIYELYEASKPIKFIIPKRRTTMQDGNKPLCPLIGTDGNIFNILGRASGTLRRHDMANKAKEMSDRVYRCGCYEDALGIIMEYVIPVTEGYEEEPDVPQFNG